MNTVFSCCFFVHFMNTLDCWFVSLLYSRGWMMVHVLAVLNVPFWSLQDLNLPVVGSQIVGLIPLMAMLDCAAFYINRDRLFILEEEHKVRLVRSSRFFLH